MKITTNLKRIVCNSIFFFQATYTLLCVVSDSLARVYVQLFLVIAFLAFVKEGVKRKSIRIFLLQIVWLGAFIVVNALSYGLAYVTHLDYYAFVLIMIVWMLFLHDEYIVTLKDIFTDYKKFWSMIILYYFAILLSIVFREGLKATGEWGISVPILYGPFTVPHVLSYSQILIYCMASYHFRITNKKVYFGIMLLSIICCVWSGARSGLVGMFIIVASDFLSLRRFSKKAIIAIIGAATVFYIFSRPEILNTIPVFQKTLEAAQKGSISNGREMFSSYLIDYYLSAIPTRLKIYGISIDGIRKLMFLRWGNYIHAHNDFLNILIGFGFLGFIPFILVLLSLVRRTKKGFLLFLLLFSLAYTNGLYMYVAFSSATPLLLVYYNGLFKNKSTENGEAIR